MFEGLQVVCTVESVGYKGRRWQEVNEVGEKDKKVQSQESHTEKFGLHFSGCG